MYVTHNLNLEVRKMPMSSTMRLRAIARKSLVVFTTLALLAGCASQPPRVAPKQAVFTILHQSNRQGTLEPCGCEVNPFGGIDREKNAVEQFKNEGNALFYVDAGNTFFATERKGSASHYVAKAKNLVGMLNVAGLDVLSPGPIDYETGIDSLRDISKKAQFPFVSTNVVDASGKTIFAPYALIEKKGLIIAFVSATPPSSGTSGYTVQAIETSLPKTIKEVRTKSDVVVLLSQMGINQNETLAKTLDVDIIVGADPSRSSDTAFSLEHGKTLLVDTASYGYRLGKLDVDLRLPFVGFSSPKAIEQNLAIIKGAETIAKAKPRDKTRQAYVASLKAQSQMALIPGGSNYQHALIALDKKRFGTPNEVTQLLDQDKKEARLRSLSE